MAEEVKALKVFGAFYVPSGDGYFTLLCTFKKYYAMFFQDTEMMLHTNPHQYGCLHQTNKEDNCRYSSRDDGKAQKVSPLADELLQSMPSKGGRISFLCGGATAGLSTLVQMRWWAPLGTVPWLHEFPELYESPCSFQAERLQDKGSSHATPSG